MEATDEDSRKKEKGGGFLSKVARRVSVSISARRGSNKPNGGSSSPEDSRDGQSHSRESSRRPSWNPESVGAVYGNAPDDSFEMSMEGDVLLPVRRISPGTPGYEHLSARSSAGLDALPRPLSIGSKHSRVPSNGSRKPEQMTVEARVSSLGLPKPRRVSSVNRSVPISDPAFLPRHSGFDLSAMPVSSIPVAISRAEAARTPRASLVPIPGGDTLLPAPQHHRASWVPPPDAVSRAQTSPNRRSSNLSAIETFDAVASPNKPAAVSPPVAPRDRRRSGMPDAFAVPFQHIAVIAAAEEGAVIAEAYAETVHGDPKFEPYRDMLKSGASEVQVAEAMKFFGVNHVEFFGRDVLADAGIFGEQTEERKRDTLVWIEKKLEHDRKSDSERNKPRMTEPLPVIKAVKKASGHQKLPAQDARTGSSGTTASREPSLKVPPKEETKPESDAYRALIETQQRVSNLSEAEILLRLKQQQQEDEERQRATRKREVDEEEARLLAKYEEHLQQREAERLLKAKSQERYDGVHKSRDDEDALRRYRELPVEQSDKARPGKDEQPQQEDVSQADEERQRLSTEAETRRQARAEAELKTRQAREVEMKRKADEEKSALEQKARVEEKARLKALEDRIEQERAKSPPPPVATKHVLRSADSSASSPPSPKPAEGALAPPEIEGLLLKKTKGGQWHSRAFTLRDKELSWVKSDQRTIARLILTKDSNVRDVPVGLKKFMFEVTVPSYPPLMVSAAGAMEKTEWIRAIRFAITGKLDESAQSLQTKGSLMMLQKNGKVTSAVTSTNQAVVAKANHGSLPKPGRPPSNASDASFKPGPSDTGARPMARGGLDAVSTVLPSAQANEKLAEKMGGAAARFAKPQLPMCASCGTGVYKMEEVALKNSAILHRKCFVCAHCKRQLTVANFVQHANKIYCQTHYNELFLEERQDSDNKPVAKFIDTSTSKFGPNRFQFPATSRAATSDAARAGASTDGAGAAASTGSSTPVPHEFKRPISVASTQQQVNRADSSSLGGKLGRTASKLFMSAALGGASSTAVRVSSSVGPADIDNSAALSKPIVPSGKRRAPSMKPAPSSATRTQLGIEPQDRMTSDFTFKVLLDPSSPKDVLWMHASSRFERDHWVNCLCNVIQVLEMRRILADAQKVDMMSAVQAQQDLEDFLEGNETSYSGYCEKLSVKSHRNWKRRWFSLSESGELKYSEDESKKVKSTLRLTNRSVVFDARDVRLSGPLTT